MEASHARLFQSGLKTDGGWCMCHHREGCVKSKSKTDGSMQRAASDPTTLALMFSIY
jgi:hypothetical protein